MTWGKVRQVGGNVKWAFLPRPSTSFLSASKHSHHGDLVGGVGAADQFEGWIVVYVFFFSYSLVGKPVGDLWSCPALACMAT